MSTLIYNSIIQQEGRYRIIDADVENAALESVNEITYKTPSGKEVPFRKVKYGEWIENDNGSYSCSLCQSWIPREQYYYAQYCLHCGADMGGKTNE